MALSGSVSTNSYKGRYYSVTWKASQSVANNQSTLSWTLSATGGNNSWYAERTLNVIVAGNTVFEKSAKVERKAGTIASGTVVISHDSNGEASFSIKINAAVYTSAVNCTGSDNFNLDAIPRKSTLEVKDGTLNKAQTLTVSRKSSSFTHTIVAECGSTSSTVCTKSSNTSIAFTPPVSWASQNKSGTSVSVKYIITTYSGNTNIGSNIYTVSCSIPANVKPSCKVSVSDPLGYADKYGGYLKGVSKLAVTVEATEAYGAAIASYSTSADGITYNKANFTSNEIKGSGSLEITSKVTDKRGRSGSSSAKIEVLDYTIPCITELSVKRCNQNGDENDQGEYVKASFAAKVSSVGEKNAVQYTLQYKKSASKEYTSVDLSGFSNVYDMTGSYIFQASSASSYDVRLIAKDAISAAVSKKTSASTGYTIMHWLKSGLGMAIGKLAEITGYLDIGYKTFFRDNVVFSIGKAIYGMDADGNKVSIFSPRTTSGNTVLGYANYASKSGDTSVYGHDVTFGVSNISSPTGFRPYYRQGDSLSDFWYGAGFITNAGKNTVFCIPLAKPVIGNPIVTITSIKGMMLRQNAKYLYGSSASVYVTPVSYTASLAFGGSMIAITAVFDNITNVTNNSPVGIAANVKISFS